MSNCFHEGVLPFPLLFLSFFFNIRACEGKRFCISNWFWCSYFDIDIKPQMATLLLWYNSCGNVPLSALEAQVECISREGVTISEVYKRGHSERANKVHWKPFQRQITLFVDISSYYVLQIFHDNILHLYLCIHVEYAYVHIMKLHKWVAWINWARNA